MASPTVVRAKGQQRKTNINEEEFAFASPSQNQNGYGATTSRNMSYNGASGKAPEPDVVQSVQRELLMLRHQLSPQKGHGRKGKATVSPQKPAVLFGNVMEHNSKEQKIVLHPRLPEYDPNNFVPVSEVKQFVGNVVTLLTSTDPSLSVGKSLKKKLNALDVSQDTPKDLASSMHETVLAVREMCRIFCKQRIQLAELVSQRSSVGRVLQAATDLSRDAVVQDLARERQRVIELEEELGRAQGKQLELEGEIQLMSMDGVGLAGGGGPSLGGQVDSSSHPRVTLETLLEAQASQSKQLTEVLQAVRSNQAEIAVLKSTRGQQAAAATTAAKSRRVSSASVASSRRSSKMEKLRKVALSTDSEQESFDKNDSSDEEGPGGRQRGESGDGEAEESSPSGPAMNFGDVVSAARGANSNSSWGKLKSKMPQIRRRHGIHSSISAPPVDPSILGKSAPRSAKGVVFDDSDDNGSGGPSRRKHVPSHMRTMGY